MSLVFLYLLIIKKLSLMEAVFQFAVFQFAVFQFAVFQFAVLKDISKCIFSSKLITLSNFF